MKSKAQELIELMDSMAMDIYRREGHLVPVMLLLTPHGNEVVGLYFQQEDKPDLPLILRRIAQASQAHAVCLVLEAYGKDVKPEEVSRTDLSRGVRNLPGREDLVIYYAEVKVRRGIDMKYGIRKLCAEMFQPKAPLEFMEKSDVVAVALNLEGILT